MTAQRPPTKSKEPVEMTWIRKRVAAALRGQKIGLLPVQQEALARVMWEVVKIERDTSARLVGAAFQGFGLDDERRVELLMTAIVQREEFAPGKVRAGEEVVDLAVLPSQRSRSPARNPTKDPA